MEMVSHSLTVSIKMTKKLTDSSTLSPSLSLPLSTLGYVMVSTCDQFTVMKLQIKVNDQGIIEDVKFKTFGCGSAIASSSYMTERVRGMTLDEAGAIKNTEIAKELCLPPVKLHCSSEFFSFFASSNRTSLLTMHSYTCSVG